MWIHDPHALTPVQFSDGIWFKRDDLFCAGGCRGGKVRICLAIAQKAAGLTAASHRHSPQMAMVSRIARLLGIPCRIHTASGAATPQMEDAAGAGAQIIQHKPGYNGVIISRARADAEALGWREVPFGMEGPEAVPLTSAQTANFPSEAKRV